MRDEDAADFLEQSLKAMRIENNRIVESTGVGSITIIPEDEEDIWEMWSCAIHLTCSYNLLSVGDVIRSKTVRKVKSTSSTDMVTVTKKVLTLSLKVVQESIHNLLDYQTGI